jgi:hypothetical protein
MHTPLTYDRLAELAYKKITGGLTETEAIELTIIIESSPDKKKFFEELMDPDAMAEQIVLMNEFDVDASWKKVKEQYPFPQKRRGWWQYAVAASAILVAGFVSFYLLRNENNKHAVAVTEKQHSPENTISSESIATINKPDGAVITVSQAQAGIIDYIGSQPLEMKGDVLIVPAIALAGEAKATVIKTLPGKDLNIQLTDGSKVLMYGNSDLRFPAGSTAGKRAVALQGEAYFEVAKNGSPFTVQARDMEVEVLGTEFNVKAYKANGPVTTSLFTGKVRLKAPGGETMELAAREEVEWFNNRFSKKGLPKHSENKVNGKKMGMFIFENSNARSMLDEIAENYDCDVVYNGQMPARPYSANFARNMDLNMVLQNLSKDMGIGLSLRGKTIIVDYPKAR